MSANIESIAPAVQLIALLALWLKLLGQGLLAGDRRLLLTAALGLGLSAVGTWFLGTVSTRVQRRFRDRVTIAPT